MQKLDIPTVTPLSYAIAMLETKANDLEILLGELLATLRLPANQGQFNSEVFTDYVARVHTKYDLLIKGRK